MTILSTAIQLLTEIQSKKGEISLVQLCELVEKRTNYSQSSISGVLLNIGKHPVFIQYWRRIKYNNRIIFMTPQVVKNKKFSKYVVQSNGINYDTYNKQLAREYSHHRIVNSTASNQNILMMPGEKGLDVGYILTVNDTHNITTVENNQANYLQYKKRNLPTDHVYGSIGEVIRDDSTKWHTIIYDSCAPFGETIANDLLYINDFTITRFISLTLQKTKKMRNHGTFVDQVRSEYSECDNMVEEWLCHNMTNYVLDGDPYTYRCDDADTSKPMIIYRFKRK